MEGHGHGGQGRKRPLPQQPSGPRARARAVLYGRLGRPLDGAAKDLLARVCRGWDAEREAAAAEAAAAAEDEQVGSSFVCGRNKGLWTWGFRFSICLSRCTSLETDGGGAATPVAAVAP